MALNTGIFICAYFSCVGRAYGYLNTIMFSTRMTVQCATSVDVEVTDLGIIEIESGGSGNDFYDHLPPLRLELTQLVRL